MAEDGSGPAWMGRYSLAKDLKTRVKLWMVVGLLERIGSETGVSKGEDLRPEMTMSMLVSSEAIAEYLAASSVGVH